MLILLPHAGNCRCEVRKAYGVTRSVHKDGKVPQYKRKKMLEQRTKPNIAHESEDMLKLRVVMRVANGPLLTSSARKEAQCFQVTSNVNGKLHYTNVHNYGIRRTACKSIVAKNENP